LHSGSLDLGTGGDTVWAVVLGAVLATLGGFVATQLEGLVRRRERERGAAVLFGEILSVVEVIVAFTRQSRERGDPYGPLTMRLLRAVRRETEAYDRNRESLYDLRDIQVRARIHALMVRVTLALEGVFEMTSQIALAKSAADALDRDDPACVDALARVEALAATRDAAFGAMMETMGQAQPIIATLKPLAKQTFEANAAVVSDF
jgi:hypothetical protein